MSPGVFDAGRAERLRERINQDGAFHQLSQDMTLNLALETDGAARLTPRTGWGQAGRTWRVAAVNAWADVARIRNCWR